MLFSCFLTEKNEKAKNVKLVEATMTKIFRTFKTFTNGKIFNTPLVKNKRLILKNKPVKSIDIVLKRSFTHS